MARAIVNRPPLLLADEPTGNLDSRTGRHVMELLEGLSRDGVTVVMVTHSSECARYAHRILHMCDGLIAREEQVQPRLDLLAHARNSDGSCLLTAAGTATTTRRNEMKKMLIVAAAVAWSGRRALAWSFSSPEGVGVSKVKANPERYVGKLKMVGAGRQDGCEPGPAGGRRREGLLHPGAGGTR